MGLSYGVAPNMGAVRFSNDPHLVNTDFQTVVCIGTPCIYKTAGCQHLATRLDRMDYDVIFVRESATDVLESVGGFWQRWIGTPKIIDLQSEILMAQMAAERCARRTGQGSRRLHYAEAGHTPK